LRRKTALTQDIADLLRKFDVDIYCSENAMQLAIELVTVLENKARVSIHQAQKI
jgi:hypothetical protein